MLGAAVLAAAEASQASAHVIRPFRGVRLLARSIIRRALGVPVRVSRMLRRDPRAVSDRNLG